MNFIYSTTIDKQVQQLILISLVGTDVSVSGSLMWEEAGAPGEAPRLNVIGYHWPQNCCSRILMKPHYTASTMYPTQTHTHTLTLNHSCTAVTALCLPNIFTANIKKPNMLTKQSSQNTDLMFNTSTDGSE